jgi:hypothetical protein
MALTIARSEIDLAATTAFQAMDNLMASSVSSSFVVPSGVSKLVSVDLGTTADGSDEYAVLARLAGNGMSDGEQYVVGAANVASTTATGTASNYISKDTDFNVISGNSIELSIAVTNAATISATAVMTFA